MSGGLFGSIFCSSGAGGGATLPIDLTTDVSGILPFANGGAGGINTNKIAFGVAGGILGQDNDFVYNPSTKRLGIGTTTAFRRLEVVTDSGSDGIRIRTTGVNNSGTMEIDAEGDALYIADRGNSSREASIEYETNNTADWKAGMINTSSDYSIKTPARTEPDFHIQKSTGEVGLGTDTPESGLHVMNGGVLLGGSTLGGAKGLGELNGTNIWIRGVQGPMRNTARATGEAAYTTTALDYIISVTITPAPRTITLGTASRTRGNAAEWVPIIVKDLSGGAGTFNITIDTEDSSKIDGADSITITVDYGAAIIYSDGTNWFTL